MEDVLSETIVAHRASRLALIIVVAGLTIGDGAILRADEAASWSRQAASGASLFPPQSTAPGFVDPPETPQPRTSLLPPPSRPAAATIGLQNNGSSDDRRPHRRSVAISGSFTPQRLIEQAAQHLAEADTSLRRQATYSAKASAIQSLRLLAEARDYADGQTTAAERLREGLAAIRESSDFLGRYGPIDRD
ncbi:MAG: hypothetical protein WD119_01640, partial [Pirellulaceae bacterium]